MEVSVQLRTPAALPVEKEATLHIEWGVGWISERFWIFWIHEEPVALLPMPGIKLEFLVYQAHSLVIIPTEISWLPEGGMTVVK